MARSDQVLVALRQVAPEIQRAVAVGLLIGEFDFIQHGADLLGAKRRVAEELDELLEGPLEVDVVLPEGVVGVEDQVQAFGRVPRLHGTIVAQYRPETAAKSY